MKVKVSCIEDKATLDKYLKYNNYPGCEFSAANNILWSQYYNTGYVIIEDMLSFCKLSDGKPVCFSFPVGPGDERKAFDKICDYMNENGLDFKMYLVERNMFEKINRWYPEAYEIKYDRDSADYLYTYDTLSELKGKKLHAKRNHINYFLENYPDYVFEDINDENAVECREMSRIWEINRQDISDMDVSYEIKALEYALENMKPLGLEGGLLRADGKVVAFTIGEPLTKDTYVIHFEKAYADIRGAYPMINREYVRRRLSSYKYINREEDMGIPGLRHAKTSYQPVGLVEKGIVTPRVTQNP